MGRFGFHAGKVNAKRVEINGKYVNEREFIWAKDCSTNVSGSAATASLVGMNVDTYKFDATTRNELAFVTVVPTSIDRNTKLDLRLYWTCSGSITDFDGAVVWDADYWPISLYTSGVSVSGETYAIQSSVAVGIGNATVTTPRQSVSGVIAESVLTVPAGDVKAGDLLVVQLARDTAESADTLSVPAHLIGVLLEYADE